RNGPGLQAYNGAHNPNMTRTAHLARSLRAAAGHRHSNSAAGRDPGSLRSESLPCAHEYDPILPRLSAGARRANHGAPQRAILSLTLCTNANESAPRCGESHSAAELSTRG